MPDNYVLIEKITVGAAGASSVTFSGIPQTGYTDLVVRVSARTSRAAVEDGMGMYFNADTTNYDWRTLVGNGSSASSTNKTSAGFGTTWIARIDGNNSTASTFASVDVYIPNYTSSSQKSYSVDSVTENNATEAYAHLSAILFSSTAAVSSITLLGANASFVANSTFYLYGVAKLNTTPAILPYATGGDTIMTDGDYWYHAFRSSGTFAPITNLSCDVLVVAGGGAGGGSTQNFPGGGGGAGGVLAHSNQSLVATNYTVTIGAGGAASNTSDVDSGSGGNNSQFGSLTASLFGVKGGTANGPGGVGACGSSGGTAGNYSTGWWAPVAGQGFRGGYNTASSVGTGGGGGAGSMGADVTGISGGTGGNAVNAYTNWGSLSAALTATGTGVSNFIAGGGGGGGAPAYGSVTQALGGGGGGGNGGTTGSTGVTSGTANTGAGGGGAGGTNTTAPPYGVSGAGGSGLVIVRYPV